MRRLSLCIGSAWIVWPIIGFPISPEAKRSDSCSLVSHPSLMLVDEPTAQLDMHTAATVSDALMRIAQADTIVVVVSTHDPRTRDVCTDIIDLKDFQ